MSSEDFLLSAIALFVFFFVVMPAIRRLCSGVVDRKSAPQTEPESVAQPKMRRAG